MDFQQTNILSMTGNSDFATTADLAGYVDLTTSQTITSGIKTFTTLPQSSAVPTTANQLVNKNYVDGTFCTLGTTQTLTGAKTFNVNVRLNNTRQLIFGTTTGAVLNFTGANMYYDNQAGGGHYFFISGSTNTYIDTDGLNIENGKYLLFNGKRCSMIDNGTQLVYNVPTGNSHSFRTNNVQRLTIDGNGISLATDNRIFFASGSRIVEEGSFSNILYDTPTGFKHQFRVNNFDAVAISSDTNGTIFTFPSGTIMREYTSFNWFLYQLPASHALIYQVAGNNILEVSSGGATLYESLSMRNGKRLVWDEGFTNIAYLRKDTTTSTLDYEVATGYSHKFMVNSVAQLLLNTTGATFTGGIYMKAGQAIYPDDTLVGGAISSGGSGGIRFDADTGGTFRFINDSTLALTIDGANITIPANQTLTFGPTGSNITHFAGTTLRYNVPTGDTHVFRINAVDQLQILPTGIKTTGGYFIRQGSGGAFGASVFNNWWNGVNLQAYVDGVLLGNYVFCDRRLKNVLQPARPVLERLCLIEMVEYETKEIGIFKPNGRQMGMMADQIEDLFPELNNITNGKRDGLTADGTGLQPMTINAEFSNLYLKGIQELNAKVEAQQAQIDGLLVAMAKLVSQQIV